MNVHNQIIPISVATFFMMNTGNFVILVDSCQCLSIATYLLTKIVTLGAVDTTKSMPSLGSFLNKK